MYRQAQQAHSLFKIGSLGIIMLGGLTGCVDYVQTHSTEKVNNNAPATWKSASKGQHAQISTGWLSEFNAPEMSRLVNEAVSNNPNLNAAAARLRATRLGTINTTANRLPSLSTSTSTTRSRSGNGSASSSGSESYRLSLSASWEPDIWGRLKDLDDASIANYQSGIADFRNARLSLAASTASAYYNLVATGQQLQLAAQTLLSFQRNRDIVERNYKAGVPGTRAIAVQLSRTNVASAQRSLENSTLQRDNAARTLEVLLGRYPAATIKAQKDLPELKKEIPVGLPTQLVARRPDLVAAQLDVYRSAKQADAAQKNLLPSLNFSSGLSTGDDTIRNLLDPSFITRSVTASLSQALYNGGSLRTNADAALENNQAAIHAFTNTAINAFREVEDAIARDTSLMQQETFLITEVKQATFAEKSAELDYSEGIENSGILEILESQRRANNARASLINIRNNRLQNRIDLHLALGGDYRTLPSK